MAYNENIPQATDKLSVSQGQLLANFQAIKTLIDVNHEDFAVAAQGKHKQVDFTDQTSNLPITVAATTRTMYLATEPSFPNLGQQLYLKNSAGNLIALTGSQTGLSSGWTFLPSGLKMAWFSVYFIAVTSRTVIFNTGNLGSDWPGFTTPATVFFQISPFSTSAITAYMSAITPAANPSVTINKTGGTNAGDLVYISAIGL